MVIIISEAKLLDFKQVNTNIPYSFPVYVKEAEQLVKALRRYSRHDLKTLLNVNETLADLNYNRYQEWCEEFNPPDAKQAALAFNGEVFNGLNAETFSLEDLNYAQEHLRILSALHGCLRPLDLIRPYRLDMGANFKINKKENLYAFWGNKIHNHLKDLIANQQEKVLINLASNEYVKAAKPNDLPFRIITPVFKELRQGDEYKTIVIYLKKARGLLTSFIIKNRIENPEEIKLFDYEGYAFHHELSTKNEWVFTR